MSDLTWSFKNLSLAVENFSVPQALKFGNVNWGYLKCQKPFGQLRSISPVGVHLLLFLLLWSPLSAGKRIAKVCSIDIWTCGH